MKKFLICLLIILSFVLIGCGKSSDTATDLPTPLVSEIPALDLDNQKDFIMSHYDEWKLSSSTWYYCINDLDHNGRLDLIVAELCGTGQYTYAYYYEIDSSFLKLDFLSTDLTEGDSWPDIIVDSADCYYDSASNSYYYIFDDVLKNGYAETYMTKSSVCLKNSFVEHKLICSQSIILDDDSEVISYFNSSGAPIDLTTYNSSVAVCFSDMDHSIVNFDWVQVDDYIPREPSLIFAEDLYNSYGFIHQLCDKTGVYDFAAINSDNVTWEVYILDSEFTDAERFIPQAYTCSLKGDGSLSIKEGQWIYIYCPCNEWTAQSAPERCAFSWGLNPDKDISDYSSTVSNKTSDSIVITKQPTSESLTQGGNTWFISHASGADSLTWVITDPTGVIYSLNDAQNANPGLSLSALDGDTLALTNVPLSFNGWSVQAKFENATSEIYSDCATVYVGDFVSLYSSVINLYSESYKNGDYSSAYAFDHNISECFSYSSGAGYAFKDLDKNGIPELIVAGLGSYDSDTNILYGVYTLINNNPVKICESSARSRYYLLSDSRLLNEGSSGASCFSFDIFKVDNSNFSFIEGYSTDNYIDEPGISYFHTAVLDSEGYPDYSNYDSVLSLDDGNNLLSALRNLEWVPQLTSIS